MEELDQLDIIREFEIEDNYEDEPYYDNDIVYGEVHDDDISELEWY